MKKLKNLVIMLAFALFFVGAMGVTKASADDPTPAADYDNEFVTIPGATQVYYQVVKNAEATTGLKPANWIPAAAGASNTYYVDFSALSNTKDVFIAYTDDNTASTAVGVVTVDAKIKSLKLGLNYTTEKIEAANGLKDVIATLDVKGVEKADDAKVDNAGLGTYGLKWKRGVNDSWQAVTAFDTLEWDMLKASNGTLYVCATQVNSVACRYSKEAKVKIPKAAKAPAVKIDFVKGTIGLKNGMEFRYDKGSGAFTDWIKVPLKDKDGTDDLIFTKTAATKTKESISSVTYEQLKTDAIITLGSVASIADGAAITLEVRTAATDKKFMSTPATVTFDAPVAATALAESAVEIGYVKQSREAGVTPQFEIDFANIFKASLGAEDKYDNYEYILMPDGVTPNFDKQKWTKVPSNGKIDLKSKIESGTFTYIADGSTTSQKAKYTEAKTIYVRKAAVKEDTKNPGTGAFASAYDTATLTIAEATFTLTRSGATASSAKADGKDIGESKVVAGAKIELTYANDVTAATADVAGVKPEFDGKVVTFFMPASDVTVIVTAPAAAAEES